MSAATALTVKALDLLRREGPLTTSVLAGTLGTELEAVRATLRKLTDQGRAQRAGLAFLPNSGRSEVRWAITPMGEAFLLEGETRLWAGGLPHQVLSCASGEELTSRELWERVKARYAPDVNLPDTKGAVYSLRDRGLLAKGTKQATSWGRAPTYRLSPAGEGALSRLPLLKRLTHD